METKQETIFADGFFFERPKEGAPEFIKGKVSIQAVRAIAFINQHKSEAGYVTLDLCKSREKGTLYLKLNQWVPAKKENIDAASLVNAPTEDINPEDIPFS